MKRWLAKVMVLMLMLSAFYVPSHAEDVVTTDAAAEAAVVETADTTTDTTTTDPDLVDAFVEEVYALSNQQEFVDLLILISETNDRDGMLGAYEDAFNGLTSGQQDRLESFGVTLEAMRAFAEYVGEEEFSKKNLLDYLGLDGSKEDQDDFRAAIVSREEEFREAMEAAGADVDKLDLGFARLDKLFGMLQDASTMNDLGISLAFFTTTEDYGDFELDEAIAAFLVTIANRQLENDIDDSSTVVSGIQDFADYYNDASNSDRELLFDYLYAYGFVKVIEEESNTGGGGGNNGRAEAATADIADEAIAEGVIEDEETPQGAPTFLDLDGYQWAVEAINALYGAGVINGVTATELMPGKVVTRAEFAAMLSRLLALTEAGDISGFKDVTAGAWYYDSVAKAYQAGIMFGKNDMMMAPEAVITRQEMATMISRTMVLKGIAAPTTDEIESLLAVFNDRNAISDWAVEGAAMSTEQGIVQGIATDAGLNFSPRTSATRAEAIVMLYRLSKVIDTVLTPAATDAAEAVAQ